MQLKFFCCFFSNQILVLDIHIYLLHAAQARIFHASSDATCRHVTMSEWNFKFHHYIASPK